MPAATALRPFSDQLRDAIRNSGRPINQLGRDAGVDDGMIHRFLSGDRGLTTATLDKLARALSLRVVEAAPTPGRPRKPRA